HAEAGAGNLHRHAGPSTFRPPRLPYGARLGGDPGGRDRRGRVIEAVTYDFWETIAREAHETLLERRTRAWSELLRDSEVPPEIVRRAFEETWRIHSEHWRAGRQFTPVMAAERAVEDLGVAVSDRLRSEEHTSELQ